MNVATLLQYFLLFAIIFDASIAWFVLLKNPRHAINQAYFLMILFVTLWQVSNYVVSYQAFTEPWELNSAVRIVYVAAVLLLASVMYFIFLFPNRSHDRRIAATLFIPAVSVAGIGVSTPALVETVSRGANELVIQFGWGYAYFPFLILMMIVGVFITIIERWINAESEREQIQYICLGLSVPLVFGFFTNLFSPLQSLVTSGQTSTAFTSIGNIGPASTMFFSLMSGYAMLRYRLLHVRALLQRKTLSLVSAGFMALVLGATAAWVYAFRLSEAHTATERMSAALIGAIIIGVVALSFFPLQRLSYIVLGKYLRRNVVDLRKWTSEEKGTLERCVTMTDFIRTVTHQLSATLPISSICGIAYNHTTQSYRSVRSVDGGDGMKEFQFPVDEQWVYALVRDQNVCTAHEALDKAQTDAERKSIERLLKKSGGQVMMPLYAGDRLLGVIALRLQEEKDGVLMQQQMQQVTRQLSAQQGEIALALWRVLQCEYAVLQGIDAGIQLKGSVAASGMARELRSKAEMK